MEARDAFGDIPTEAGMALDALGQGTLDLELDECPCCRSRFVQPLDWAPVEDGRWRVERHCPECEWSGVGVYDQDVVDHYDDVLDAGTERLVMDLRLTVRANMLERMNGFIEALYADRILPEDF
ncbi:hypothetical protein HJD18_16920 [Thermoleophilia bacterium SCSIO 60948]|nr:hypothetical protein HJD18_16920 [Thermoleophilia bacterium SCSIO 60948]